MERFDEIIDEGRLLSTREVFREIEDGSDDVIDWANQNKALFATPKLAEAQFIAKIYGVPQFQQNIEQQKLLKGGKHADSFVIAKAAVERCTVVTMEKLKPNAVKIPNICAHFRVKCYSLEEFMEEEGWEF